MSNSDSSRWQMPELREPSPEGLGGRGLFLVDALAETWVVRPRNTGKTVWAHLRVRPRGAFVSLLQRPNSLVQPAW